MTRRFVAPLFLPVLLALTGCSNIGLERYEQEEFSSCYADQGAWAGEARSARYVGKSFDDFDRHFRGFLTDLDHVARAPSTPPSPEKFAALHSEAKANIVRLGRLLPRMNRPLDLAPAVSQFAEKSIAWPRGDHHTEFLRVALAQEFVEHQNLAAHMSAFLSHFAEVEALLLDLKHGGEADQTGPRADMTALRRATAKLAEGWEGVEPGMRRVIFDRPDMPKGESLSERLQARVMAICASYSDCANADGAEGACRPGASATGPSGEAMEAP